MEEQHKTTYRGKCTCPLPTVAKALEVYREQFNNYEGDDFSICMQAANFAAGMAKKYAPEFEAISIIADMIPADMFMAVVPEAKEMAELHHAIGLELRVAKLLAGHFAVSTHDQGGPLSDGFVGWSITMGDPEDQKRPLETLDVWAPDEFTPAQTRAAVADLVASDIVQTDLQPLVADKKVVYV